MQRAALRTWNGNEEEVTNINVLLVDDSATIRNLLRSVLLREEGIQVCGVARNGRDALERIESLSPDIVVLDIEMPVMSGLEVLPRLRQRWPELPVIMFSSLTEAGAKATFEALTLGANECVCKPSGGASLDETIQTTADELVPKIRNLVALAHSDGAANRPRRAMSLTPIRSKRQSDRKPAQEESRDPSPSAHRGRASSTAADAATRPPTEIPAPSKSGAAWQGAEILAISASTGGPNALLKVLKGLAADFPIPIIVTQHIPENFASKLVSRFDRECALTVIEVDREVDLKPGCAYFPTGDHHLLVKRKGTSIVACADHGEPENFCRPAADPMLRSAVEVYGGRIVSVVLTGMGCDAMAGSLLVRERGGKVLAQDEATSVVWGMPGAIVKARGADKVLPLDMIAGEINLVARPRLSGIR